MYKSSKSNYLAEKCDSIEHLQHLTLDELCTQYEKSPQDHPSINEIFTEKFAENIEFDDLILNMAEITRVIECFGPLIHTITIYGSIMWELNQAVLDLMHVYCRLKYLRLICFRVDKSIVITMTEILQTVEKLELIHCSKQNRSCFEEMFLQCDQLKELIIFCPDILLDAKFLTRKYKQLRKLILIVGQINDDKVLAEFFNNHPKVRHFNYLPQLAGPKKSTSSMSWANIMDDLPSKIQDFGIQLSPDIADQRRLITGLGNLKRIVIDFSRTTDKSVGKFLGALSTDGTLDTVSIWSAKCSTELGHGLAKFNSNLTTLELRQFPKSCDLKSLIITADLGKNLNNLQNLYLDHTSVRSADDILVLIKHFRRLANLYLCDMRNFFLLPTKTRLQAWCLRVYDRLNIFVDSLYMKQIREYNLPDNAIQFIPFENRLCQMVNVTCEI